MATTYAANEHGQAITENGEILVTEKDCIYIGNEQKVIVFDTYSEYIEFLQALPKPWSQESYAQELNDAHNALFRKLLADHNYIAIGELPLWINDANFGEEAAALTMWWRGTCKQVAEYLESVTEETAMSVEDFINQLPAL